MATVADRIVQSLVQAGARRIYGVVGDSLNSIVDAVRRTPEMQWVAVRHEEAAAYAAGAEAQTTGRLGVCAGSCGPGNVHLINGLYDCNRSYAPVLAIAAHIPSGEIGTTYFQETHPDRLFVDCSQFCEMISTARQVPRTLRQAIQSALQRRGVSVLTIPGDVALEQAVGPWNSTELTHSQPEVRPTDASLDQLVGLLEGAERITLLCGSGCAGAHAEVMALADRLGAPVVHALRGKEHVEFDNPFDVGMTGLIGFASGYRAMESCDLLVMLGTDFPYDGFYPSASKVVQIDLRGENLGRRTRLDLGLVGDIRSTLEALLPRLKQKDRAFLEARQRDYRATRDALDSRVKELSRQDGIHPQYVAATLSELAQDDAIFTADTGMSTVWAARYLRMKRGRRLLGSFNHGSMANALPQAIGAQCANPDRQVVSFSGDGGLGMLMGELLTLVQHDLPVKVVVFNNSTLGMVKLEMQVAGLPNFGTDFKHFDFARIAEGAGIRSFRVDRGAELAGAVSEALRHPGPALVDVHTTPYELSMPPKVELAQAWGFSLFMLREVVLGHSKDLIQQLRDNLD
jgi:pyruvate dehydrogenase (quinone)